MAMKKRISRVKADNNINWSDMFTLTESIGDIEEKV